MFSELSRERVMKGPLEDNRKDVQVDFIVQLHTSFLNVFNILILLYNLFLHDVYNYRKFWGGGVTPIKVPILLKVPI